MHSRGANEATGRQQSERGGQGMDRKCNAGRQRHRATRLRRDERRHGGAQERPNSNAPSRRSGCSRWSWSSRRWDCRAPRHRGLARGASAGSPRASSLLARTDSPRPGRRDTVYSCRVATLFTGPRQRRGRAAGADLSPGLALWLCVFARRRRRPCRAA